MPEARPSLTVCLTGGGTAGHVTPHFALLPELRRRGWHCFYVGSTGLEKPLVEAAGIEFKAISSGKLRRYFSVQNAVDLFKVAAGCVQALAILAAKRPDVVFSKGGFVAVPVAVAAWLLRIPVVTHESDTTPGLATRIISRFATRIIYTFPETGARLPPGSVQTGTPIREELFAGDAERGRKLCGFATAPALPTLMIMGGSQGAQRINAALERILPDLVAGYRIIHLTGKGKRLAFTHANYKGVEYASDELKDFLALADYVVSRAGANSLFELLALRKPMLLIPLEMGSRGDQVINAEAFVRNGWAAVLREGELTDASLRQSLTTLAGQAAAMRAAQSCFAAREAVAKVLGVIEAAARR
jgi:UDP-N-acetylglucosamine--N-acetylmuramyl-(pentapeptide) pyrophosphoryl-undecaprenol N-acetylglucosamine transferase